jgi:hypothetical protein
MAREICFCGWIGELEDREPVYAGDGEWGLSCPMCGRLDRLEEWSEAVRSGILAEAARRRESTLGSTSDRRQPEERPQAAAPSSFRPPLSRDDVLLWDHGSS